LLSEIFPQQEVSGGNMPTQSKLVHCVLLAAAVLLSHPVAAQSSSVDDNQDRTGESHRHRSHTCDADTLSGTYLYVASGFHLNSDNPSLTQSYPYFKIGRLEIKGTGNGGGVGSAREVLSGNNHLTDQNFSATYTIDPNEHCLLTLNLSRCVSGKCEQRSTKLAVSADGDKALSVGGQDPLEEKGEFTRVSRERHTDSCNNSTLHGRYLFQTFGFGFDPSLGFQSLDAYPFDSAGIVVADDGNFSSHDWANFGATFARRNYPALYDLNPDCTGILRQPDPTFPTAVILSAGKGEAFVLIQRETAAPVVGFFQRQ
jgi:hypothetical protein